eukprot:959460-Prorocentrum_minimum.AAC.1
MEGDLDYGGPSTENGFVWEGASRRKDREREVSERVGIGRFVGPPPAGARAGVPSSFGGGAETLTARNVVPPRGQMWAQRAEDAIVEED